MIRLLSLFFIFSLITKSLGAVSHQTWDDAGTAVQVILPAAAAGMTVMYQDKEGAIQLLKSFISTELVKDVLKWTVRSTRPNGGHHSFPSGHTAAAFSGSAFIYRRYGWMYGIPANIAAAFVGYTRVKVKAHRSQDVLIGASLGIIFNLIFTTPYIPKECEICAYSTPRGAVLALNYSF